MTTRQPLPTAPSTQFRRRPLVETAGERFRCAPLGPSTRAWLKRVYHAALMAQTGGRGLACALPHGEIVRALPEHRHLSWNPSEYEAFRAAARPGMTALDVGANVGAYSILFGQWARPSGRVFAFEPAPEPFEGLSRHVTLNKLSGTVTPLRSGVGADVGVLPLIVAGTSGESRLAVSSHGASGGEQPPGATIDVPVTTIDSFCRERGVAPDFIKVDVEGFELDVLRGARETIRRAGRNLALFVEMHPSVWPLLGITRDHVLEELDRQSLGMEPLEPHHTDVWSVEGMALRLRPR